MKRITVPMVGGIIAALLMALVVLIGRGGGSSKRLVLRSANIHEKHQA